MRRVFNVKVSGDAANRNLVEHGFGLGSYEICHENEICSFRRNLVSFFLCQCNLSLFMSLKAFCIDKLISAKETCERPMRSDTCRTQQLTALLVKSL